MATDYLSRRSRRLRIASVIAFVIVLAAWYADNGQGFDPIGQLRPSTATLPGIGEPAPDFEVTIIDEHGDPRDRVRLSDFAGQPVWLNFWGSWCPPCREEMPEIQAAYEKELAPQGLVWLAISVDEPAKDAAEFAALHDATFTIASDPNRADSGTSYPIAYFPTHILIDEQGIVRDVIISSLDREEIVSRAERILAPSP
jgi:peroxiredoxin